MLPQSQQQQEAPQEDAGVAAPASAANKPAAAAAAAAAVSAVERSAAGNRWSRLRKSSDKVGKDLATTRNISQPVNITICADMHAHHKSTMCRAHLAAAPASTTPSAVESTETAIAAAQQAAQQAPQEWRRRRRPCTLHLLRHTCIVASERGVV